MKASELMKVLAFIVETHGDVEVGIGASSSIGMSKIEGYEVLGEELKLQFRKGKYD